MWSTRFVSQWLDKLGYMTALQYMPLSYLQYFSFLLSRLRLVAYSCFFTFIFVLIIRDYEAVAKNRTSRWKV